MRSRSLLFAAILLAGVGCSEDNARISAPGDYIIFGDFYGECLGRGCIDIFKLADRTVFVDTLDLYPIASQLPHTVSFVPAIEHRFDALNELVGEIPGDLFEESDVVIGQPDAGDWGGFYLETNTSGEIRFWLIDKIPDNLPRYLRSYVNRLETAIQVAGP